jgi:predicted ATPase/class 3 adenylate cyclase
MNTNLLPFSIEENLKNNQLNGSFKSAVMIIDIVGFTALTEKFMQSGKEGAEDLSRLLNAIYEPVIKTICHYQGEIIAFEGDAVNVCFREPNALNNCLDCAYFITDLFKKQDFKTFNNEKTEISIKTGLAYDQMNWHIGNNNKHNVYLFESEAILNALNAQNRCDKNQIIAHKSIKLLINENTDEIDPDYFRLNLRPREYNHQIKGHNHNISDKIRNSFYPSLRKLRNLKGEFRNIVSLFVLLDKNTIDKDFSQSINPLVELSDLYGAYLNKLGRVESGIMALIIFGAPESHENDIQRAVTLSNELREIYHDSIKIGISYGLAYAGYIGSGLRSEYTCLGDTLNISARLMHHAGWGKIILDDSLAHKNISYFNISKIEDTLLKGKKRKISIYELKQLSIQKSDFYESGFFGRKKELYLLNNYSENLSKGKSPGIIYLYGEPGSGKSRLLYEFITANHKEIQIMHLYTDNILKKSLNSVKNFLSKYLRLNGSTNKDILNNLFEMNYSVFLNQLIMASDKRKDELFSELFNNKDLIKHLLELKIEDEYIMKMDPKNLFEITVFTLKNMFLALSLIKKTCIIVEDLQWMDKDTEYFFEVLSRTCSSYPLMIVISSRYLDDGSKSRISCNQLDENEICLPALDKSDTIEMASEILKSDLSSDLQEFIIKKTENNPFFIEQFCYYLKENSLLKTKKSKLILSDNKIQLPDSINAVIISRIDRLSQDLKEIIQIASVLGREVDIRLLDDILRHYYGNNKEDSFNSKYKKLEQQQIWVILKEIRYIFRHILIQEAIYDMQLRERLKKLHLLSAKSLEKLYNNFEEFYLNIAYHYEKADHFKKAQQFYIKAGDSLASKYDNEKAIESYQKAINIGLDKDTAFSLIFKQCKVLDTIGQKKQLESILLKAIQDAESEQMPYHIMRFKTILGNSYRSISEYDKAMQELNTAKQIAETLKDQKEISDITGLIGIVYLHTGKPDEAMASFEYKRFICENSNDRLGYGYAVSNMGVVYLKRSEYDKAMECYQTLHTICLELNDKGGLILALGNMGIIYYNKGQLDDAVNCFEQEIKLCQETGNINKLSNSYNNLGSVYWSKGELKKAFKCYEMDKKICEELGNKLGLAYSIGNMGLIHFSNNDLNKAIKSFKFWYEASKQYNDSYGLSISLSNLALAYWENGDFDKSLACFEENKSICENNNDYSQLSLVIGNIGSIHLDKGEFDQALECYLYRLESVIKHGETMSLPNCYHNLAIIYEETDQKSDAEKYFNLAVKSNQDNNNDYHLAICLTDFSSFLFNSQRFDEALNYINLAKPLTADLDDKELVVRIEIITLKLLALNDPIKALNLFEPLKSQSNSKTLNASLIYEIWKLNKNKKDALEAHNLYQELYKKVPKHTFLKRIHELAEYI